MVSRLKVIVTTLVFLYIQSICFSQLSGKPIKINKTFSYKTVDKIQISADFYSTTNKTQRPVIIWIHGGGLIFGSREDIPKEQLSFYLAAGYCVVSVDYRLAPETKLPEIVNDVRDAVQWVHKYGSDSLGIDPNNIFVVGHSGGAYLALMTGYSSLVRPRAIVSFYGYGDILSDWYNTPDTVNFSTSIISQEAAQKIIRDSVITSSAVEERLSLYFYTRQNGIWPLMVTGHNPKKERGWFKEYCPIQNIDDKYPPVFLIHGDKDTDVPINESIRLNDKLKSVGINSIFVQMKNYGHVFDIVEGGLSNPEIANAFNDVLEFLKQYE